jgi:hypothetical protein
MTTATAFKVPPTATEINDRLSAIDAELAKYPKLKELIAEQAYLKSIPRTAKQINDRMSEIGVELHKYPIIPHPNHKALVAELDYLKSIYVRVLRSGGVDHS